MYLGIDVDQSYEPCRDRWQITAKHYRRTGRPIESLIEGLAIAGQCGDAPIIGVGVTGADGNRGGHSGADIIKMK